MKQGNKFRLSFIYFILISLITFYSGCSEDDSNNPSNPPPASPNAVSIQGNAFNPGNRTVAGGTTITWTNNDNVAHTVTSGTPQNPTRNIFDSGSISPGGSFQHTFSQAGEFNYFCDFHPAMTAKITIQ